MEEARRRDVMARLAGDVDAMTPDARVALIGDLQALRAWQDAREAALLSACHLARDDVANGARDVTQLCQQQANVGYAEAKRRALRSTWATELTDVGDALTSGRLGTSQADELCALADRLAPEHGPALRSAAAELVDEVATLTPTQTRRRLQEFERSLDKDDGSDRLEKQRQANALRMPRQPDGTSGLSGQLDPVSAEYVRNAIDAAVTDMWRNEGRGRGDMSPPDRVLTNDRRRAEALVRLVRAGAAAGPATRGRAEVIVLIDHQTLLGQLSATPTARLADGTVIPAAEARRLACDAGIIPAVLGGASQPLDVGRRTRLATSAQRAALRAAHDTCCIAGCDVPFDWCEIHHITWWRHGGGTDLDNLAPVCSKHHHLIHDDRWVLTLDDERVGRLTHRRPDPSGDPLRPPDDTDRRRAKASPRPQPGRGSRNEISDRARQQPLPPEHHQPLRC